jgi:hypothetical protein
MASLAFTPNMAIRRRSGAVSFLERANAATFAISDRWLALNFLARAFPPSFPKATAAGFFLAIRWITLLA